MAEEGIDFASLLKFAIPLLWFAAKWLNENARRPPAAPAPPAPAPGRAAGPAPGGLVPRAEARVASTHAQASEARALQTELAAVGGRAEALLRQVESLGPRGEPLAEVLRAGPAELAARISEAAADPLTVARHRVALLAGHARLSAIFAVLEAQLHRRSDRFVAERLSDAEAIFDDLWAPMAAHADNHGLALPPMRPLAFPSPGAGGEAVITGLLPPAHPLLIVPADFGERLLRWPSLAHELGHLLHDGLPGLAEELIERTGWEGEGPLPGSGPPTLRTVHACLGAWRVELFCDLIATLLLGPAALAGFVAAFRRDDDPSSVLLAAAAGSRLAPHPPAHLRVLVSQAVLEAVGLGAPAAALVRGWRRDHGLEAAIDNVEDGPQIGFLIPRTDGRLLRVGERALLELVLPGLEQLLEQGLDCLAGHRLLDVPGFALNASGWAAVQRCVAPLSAGEAVHQRPRLILCAAIVAVSAAPRADAQLTANLHRCILGRSSDERRPFGSIGGPPLRAAPSRAGALREAMVLREALLGPRGGLSPAALRREGRRPGHRPPPAPSRGIAPPPPPDPAPGQPAAPVVP